MAPGPQLVVEQPHLVPPRLSLLSAADYPAMTPFEKMHFGNGFKYVPEGKVVTGNWPLCDTDEVPGDTVKTPNTTLTSNPWVDDNCAVNFWPYAIYASDQAPVNQALFRNGEARAMRKLQSSLAFNLERELWTGSLNVVGRANPSLQNAAVTLAGGPMCISDAIGTLEQAVSTGDARGEQKGGFRYMIHMRPKLFDHLVANFGTNFVRRDGNMWLTPMDNIYVAGRGYPGTGPSPDTGGVTDGPGNYIAAGALGATEWIYITPVVEIRLDDPFSLADDFGSVIRRDNNVATFWAEQIAHAAFDPTLNIYAVEVCLVECVCD